MSLLQTLQTDFFYDIVAMHEEKLIGDTIPEFSFNKKDNMINIERLLSPLLGENQKTILVNSWFAPFSIRIEEVQFVLNNFEFIGFDLKGRVDSKITLIKGG